MDEKQDCKIIACENSIFLYGGTLSWIIERVKSARNGEEKNLLSLLQTALFLCQNKWMIKVFYLIYLALKELRLVMSIVMIGLTILWLKTLRCFSFKESVSLVRSHFMLWYFLNHTSARISKQIPSEIVVDLPDLSIIIIIIPHNTWYSISFHLPNLRIIIRSSYQKAFTITEIY